jgi:hypothetical protein
MGTGAVSVERSELVFLRIRNEELGGLTDQKRRILAESELIVMEPR